MKKKISKEEYFQVTGLLTLARKHALILEDIQSTLAKLLGEKEYGHCYDAAYNNYKTEELLGKLDIKYER